MKNPSLSFCITCKGRLSDLKQTLPQSLVASEGRGDIEFVVAAYGDEQVRDWLLKTYPREIEEGRLKVVYTEAENFKHAHAKNIAHRAATKEVLCNVDADNTVTPEFIDFLTDQFRGGRNIIVGRTERPEGMRVEDDEFAMSGIAGRIALKRELFYELRGYDEHYQGWENEDGNLIKRAIATGARQVRVPRDIYGLTIENTDEQRVENLSPEAQERAASVIEEVRKTLGGERVSFAIDNGWQERVANREGRFGCATVYVNDNSVPEEFSPVRQSKKI